MRMEADGGEGVRNCLTCKNAIVTGRNFPGNMIDPPEYAEAECDFNDEDRGDIERFFMMIEMIEKERKRKFDYYETAKYCPFYE